MIFCWKKDYTIIRYMHGEFLSMCVHYGYQGYACSLFSSTEQPSTRFLFSSYIYRGHPFTSIRLLVYLSATVYHLHCYLVNNLLA